MKKLAPVIAMGLTLAFGLAYGPANAADGAKTEQQSKMGVCNKDAGEKKGDERKAFMKECLSAKKVSQQDKMKTCNKDAGSQKLKGDERKGFMKDCLSK